MLVTNLIKLINIGICHYPHSNTSYVVNLDVELYV